MSLIEQMPAESRVWIYQADRPFTSTETSEVKKRVTDFIAKWTSHTKSVKADFELRYNRFLILFLDESHVAAGGCSIDSSVHFIKTLEKEFQNTMTDRMKFAFKAGSEIEVVSKSEFEKLLGDEAITGDTIVFNNLVATKQELDTNWEVPFSKSWHKQFFGVKV
jgi:hypothetical protein